MKEFEKARDEKWTKFAPSGSYSIAARAGANWAYKWCNGKEMTHAINNANQVMQKLQGDINKLTLEAEALAGALELYAPLLVNQDLVRNIDNDGDFKMFTEQALRIATALQKTNKALTHWRAFKEKSGE